jgi:hypothetical protein
LKLQQCPQLQSNLGKAEILNDGLKCFTAMRPGTGDHERSSGVSAPRMRKRVAEQVPRRRRVVLTIVHSRQSPTPGVGGCERAPRLPSRRISTHYIIE